ncbi:MAG TPA: alcohol dehydrogenase, partial [Cytophagales bacterium]|nr:alcohol dehydrogenase [Cytophagales bacterium]
TGGICLAYGLLSLKDTPINNGLLIFKNVTVKGFWLTTWFPSLAPERMQAVVQEILGLLATQSLKADIEAVYPFDQIAEAVDHADRPGRSGKILLDLRG